MLILVTSRPIGTRFKPRFKPLRSAGGEEVDSATKGALLAEGAENGLRKRLQARLGPHRRSTPSWHAPPSRLFSTSPCERPKAKSLSSQRYPLVVVLQTPPPRPASLPAPGRQQTAAPQCAPPSCKRTRIKSCVMIDARDGCGRFFSVIRESALNPHPH